MRKCKNCQAEVENGAKVCPKCGGALGMPTWAKILIIVGVVVLLLGGCVAGCVGIVGVSMFKASNEIIKKAESIADETREDMDNMESGNEDDFELLEHHISNESDNQPMYIEEKIQNKSEKKFKAVFVTFYAYDADGNTIGQCSDSNYGLDAKDTWEFKAMCIGVSGKIDHYKLNTIHGM